MDNLSQEIKQNRKPNYPIHPLILNRWSPRSMTGEPLTDEELMPLFEAARWAPSSYNGQPWRFLYVKRDTPEWGRLFDLLIDFNQGWCAQAAVLGIISSRQTFEKTNKPSPSHALDAGAAWENLCLEGSHRGLVVHGMAGFDYAKAQELVPKEMEVLAMFAIGKRGGKDLLPSALQERELPSQRKPMSEIVFLNEM